MPFATMAQVSSSDHLKDGSGICFESGKSWEEILKQAREQHKYVFVDCYTTWCGPCKMMSRDIFPQKQVGEYFNAHFINVAIQMDKTNKDAKNIQDWYADAGKLAGLYSINAYPTYLFFSSDGSLVHRKVGATTNADEFIASGRNALNPEQQYYSFIKL